MIVPDTQAQREQPIAAPASAESPPSSTPPVSDTPAVVRRVAALESQIQELDSRLENSRLVHDSWTLIILAVAIAALLASIIAVGFGMRAIDEADRRSQSGMGPTVTAVLAV